MSTGVSFADVLFILFVGGVIYFFVYWFGPVRKARLDRDAATQRSDSQD